MPLSLLFLAINSLMTSVICLWSSSQFSAMMAKSAIFTLAIPSMFAWADGFRRWTRRLLGRPEDREIDRAERGADFEIRAPKTREHIYN